MAVNKKMKKIQPVKKRKSTVTGNTFITGLIVGLSAVIVVVMAIALYFIITGPYLGKVAKNSLYDYEYSQYFYNNLSQEANKIEFPDDATDEQKQTLTKEHWAATDEETGKTYLDLVKEKTLEDVKVFKAAYQMAIEKGYKLPSDKAKEANTSLDTMINYYINMYAQYYQQSYTKDMIIQNVFGSPMTYKQYKSYNLKMTTIQYYKDEALKPTFEPTEEALLKYYEENKDSLRTVTIQKLDFSKKSADFTAKTDEEYEALSDEDKATYDEAKQKAEDALAEKRTTIDDILAQLKAAETDEAIEEIIKTKSESTSVETDKGVLDVLESSTSVSDQLKEHVMAFTDKTDFEIFETDDYIYILRAQKVQTYENSDDSDESIKKKVKDAVLEEMAVEELKKLVNEESKYDIKDLREDKLEKVWENYNLS